MQIKWTSGQLKIMSSGPEYIADERSVWWEEVEGSDQKTASF